MTNEGLIGRAEGVDVDFGEAAAFDAENHGGFIGFDQFRLDGFAFVIGKGSEFGPGGEEEGA